MWIEYNPNPCRRGNVGDCVIRCVCASLNLDWDTAFWILSETANRMCDMPSGNAVLGAVMRKNGFIRKAIPNTCPDCYTAEDFCRDHPEGTYVLCFSGHVCCVRDGNILDSWDSSNEIPQYYYQEG